MIDCQNIKATALQIGESVCNISIFGTYKNKCASLLEKGDTFDYSQRKPYSNLWVVG